MPVGTSFILQVFGCKVMTIPSVGDMAVCTKGNPGISLQTKNCQGITKVVRLQTNVCGRFHGNQIFADIHSGSGEPTDWPTLPSSELHHITAFYTRLLVVVVVVVRFWNPSTWKPQSSHWIHCLLQHSANVYLKAFRHNCLNLSSEDFKIVWLLKMIMLVLSIWALIRNQFTVQTVFVTWWCQWQRFINYHNGAFKQIETDGFNLQLYNYFLSLPMVVYNITGKSNWITQMSFQCLSISFPYW